MKRDWDGAGGVSSGGARLFSTPEPVFHTLTRMSEGVEDRIGS